MIEIRKLKPETIGGWIINGKYYRIKNKYKALILYLLDSLFYPIFKNKKNFPRTIKNILIIRLEHIGDIILTTSFFRELKKNYPNSKITVLCRKLTKDLFKLIPWVDEVITLNTPWFSRNDSEGYREVLSFIIKNKKKYDLVFDLHPDPRNIIIAKFVGKCTVAYGIRGLRFLIDKEIEWDFNKIEHIVDRQLNILKELGLNVEKKDLEIVLNKKILSKINVKLEKKFKINDKKIILIHPISSREEKNLKWKIWKKIIKHLYEKENVLILIGGSKEDREIIEKNLKEYIDKKKVFNIAGMFDLIEYIHLINFADIIYSVDTFVVHVSSALKKKLISFYLSTSKEEWGPYINI